MDLKVKEKIGLLRSWQNMDFLPGDFISVITTIKVATPLKCILPYLL